MAFRRRQWRVRATGDRFELNLRPEERHLLKNLLPQLEEFVGQPDDQAARRLFPTAYADDPERDAEYQKYMREELVKSRLAALELVAATADERVVDEATMVGWMQSINALRLVLGTLLDVGEDFDVDDLADTDPRYPQLALYSYLSGLLYEIIEAMGGG